MADRQASTVRREKIRRGRGRAGLDVAHPIYCGNAIAGNDFNRFSLRPGPKVWVRQDMEESVSLAMLFFCELNPGTAGSVFVIP